MSSHVDGSGWETKDSGQRQSFESGAVRDTQEGKGRYDLTSPFGRRRLAGVYERGASKYGDRNFEKGIPLSRFLDSAARHINDAMRGDVSEDHIAQAAWNLDAFMHTQAMIALGVLPDTLDDLPHYLTREPEYDIDYENLAKYTGLTDYEPEKWDGSERRDIGEDVPPITREELIEQGVDPILADSYSQFLAELPSDPLTTGEMT